MLLSMGTPWLGWAMTLGSILETLGSFGSLLGRLWVACGLQWVRQGAPMSYSALLCRREHQSEVPGGPKGSMWGLKVCRAEKPCGPLWPRFATSCGPYRRIVDQILHHPALAAAGMSHPGLGRDAGGMGHPGLLGLMPCCLGLDSERQGCFWWL